MLVHRFPVNLGLKSVVMMHSDSNYKSSNRIIKSTWKIVSFYRPLFLEGVTELSCAWNSLTDVPHPVSLPYNSFKITRYHTCHVSLLCSWVGQMQGRARVSRHPVFNGIVLYLSELSQQRWNRMQSCSFLLTIPFYLKVAQNFMLHIQFVSVNLDGSHVFVICMLHYEQWVCCLTWWCVVIKKVLIYVLLGKGSLSEFWKAYFYWTF
jgi:hypothetical protein